MAFPQEKQNGRKVRHKTTEDFADFTEERKNQVKNVVKGLALGGGNFFLALTWVTKGSKLMHMKFPWSLGGDETFWISPLA